MHSHPNPWININGVRINLAEVVGYKHYYRAANPDSKYEFEKDEESYVEVLLRRNCVEIYPTESLHTDQILAELDKHLGVKA